MNIFKNFVDAVNAVNSNVWAFVALVIGVVLSLHHITLGESIIMSAFAVWRVDSKKAEGTQNEKVA